ncbi:MAG: restriction endonuclease subunit S [Microbacterium gubbeenense]
MKDSGVEWLGEIPHEWEVGNIRRFAAMRTGHTPSRQHPEYWRECDTGWFTLADVWQLREGRKYLGETSERVSKVGIRNSAAELLPAGTVVLSRTASVGFSGIMPEPMATSQDFWNWVPGDKLAPEYLWYQFLAMKPDFERLMMGSTHNTIYKSDAASIVIAAPPLAEQRAIADYLDRETAQIDEFIAENERFIELLTERRAAVIAHAVTKGLDPDVPLRDSGVEWLGAVPERWEVTGLVRYARSVGGVGFPDKEQGLEDEELAFYKVNALSRADRDGHIRERWDTISRETARRLGAKVLPAGSLLMAKIGAALLLGRVRVSELECCIDNNMMAVVPRQGAETRFLVYSLQTVDFALLANPGAVPSLDMYGFMHHPMCFPPLDEQRAIAGYLDERTARIDEAIETAREGIALAKERRSALISAAVTGKLDVTEAA